MIRKLNHWSRDYLYAIRKQGESFIFRKPPKHYLGYIEDNRSPIILIPGLFEKWHFLKAIADPLSLKGHPVYVLDHLEYNSKDIPHSAKLVRGFIDIKGLKDAILISHSKGGLIGKYLLTFHNEDGRVRKLITIATPFGGSEITKFFRHKAIRELSPDSEIVRILGEEKRANGKIVSIYGVFDNHVWPESSCYLQGAENIQVDAHGHHKMLGDKRVIEAVLAKVQG